MGTSEFDTIDSEFDERSGEELYADYMSTIEKPKDEFIVYYSAFSDVMTDMTVASLNLFTWLCFHCEVNSGRVVIQSFALKRALSDLRITLGTYYKALGLLKGKDMIKGGNAAYYVNPSYAWKGTADARSRFMRVYPRLKK